MTEAPILIYDGECAFCDASVDFVLKNEKDAKINFLWLQSPKAEELLKTYDILSNLDTIVLIEKDKAYQRSSAALKVFRYLKWPYNWMRIGLIVPRPIRDFVYDLIAKHRKKIMGSTTCELPIGKEGRFIS